jgi:LAO/AO transport system kinase
VVDGTEIVRRLRGPDPRALPRLATLVENQDPRGQEAIDLLYPLSGQAHIVGITGPPGAGKSTLVSELVRQVRSRTQRVAVIAVDPSSSLSGGAVLGDRIRMMDHHGDDGVFVRSMASRGGQGGIAQATAEMVHLLDAAGFPLILVETVGTGQDETDIASLADTVVVVEAPGLGDGVQAIKAGLLEIGDIVVVNKADQPGADEALRVLRTSLQLGHGREDWQTPVLAAVASTGTGVDELLSAIDQHGAWLDSTGNRAARREQAARAEVLAGVRAELERQIAIDALQTSELARLITGVARREIPPRQAVASIVAK